MAEQMKIRGIEITCYSDKIKIEKTYIINDKEKMEIILSEVLHRTEKFLPRRNMKSFIKEWKYHNRLYKMHIFRNHNKDIIFKDTQSKWCKFMCTILGF